MNPQEFLREFGAIANAPGGVKRLREMSYDLGITGKLCPQLEKDGTAAALLSRIGIEKQTRIEKHAFKNSIKLNSIRESFAEGIPEIPSTWVWTRLADIGEINPRNNETNDDKMTSFASMSTISEFHAVPPRPEIRPWNSIKKGFTHFADGDVVVAKITPCFENGKAAVLCNLTGGIGAGTTELHVVRPLPGVEPTYIYLFLRSNFFKIIGEKYMTGTAGQKRLPTEYFATRSFPLPPLAEQHRIVAKVDQLMALCDKLEAQQEKRSDLIGHTRKTALDALSNATGGKELQIAWQRVEENLGSLFEIPEDVEDLKKCVLQNAVMGKLVEQNPKDEPASVLLKKIAAEKAELVKKGEIKKDKPLPEIREDEKPFEIPKGWEWCRFFTINTVQNELVQSTKFPDEQQIAPDLIAKGNGILIGKRTVRESGSIGPNNRFYKGHILYSKIRPSLNKTVIAPYNGLCSADMYPIKSFVNSDFMLIHILSEQFLKQVRLAENRVKMPKLNLESLGVFICPLPPLAEQQRIVLKTQSLLAHCDTLQSQISKSRTIAENLAQSVVESITGITMDKPDKMKNA